MIFKKKQKTNLRKRYLANILCPTFSKQSFFIFRAVVSVCVW